jgi:hypothetical protein
MTLDPLSSYCAPQNADLPAFPVNDMTQAFTAESVIELYGAMSPNGQMWEVVVYEDLDADVYPYTPFFNQAALPAQNVWSDVAIYNKWLAVASPVSPYRFDPNKARYLQFYCGAEIASAMDTIAEALGGGGSLWTQNGEYGGATYAATEYANLVEIISEAVSVPMGYQVKYRQFPQISWTPASGQESNARRIPLHCYRQDYVPTSHTLKLVNDPEKDAMPMITATGGAGRIMITSPVQQKMGWKIDWDVELRKLTYTGAGGEGTSQESGVAFSDQNLSVNFTYTSGWYPAYLNIYAWAAMMLPARSSYPDYSCPTGGLFPAWTLKFDGSNEARRVYPFINRNNIAALQSGFVLSAWKQLLQLAYISNTLNYGRLLGAVDTTTLAADLRAAFMGDDEPSGKEEEKFRSSGADGAEMAEPPASSTGGL